MKILQVKHLEARRAIDESMRTGAARIVDDWVVLDGDPAKHRVLLTEQAMLAQGGDPRAWQVVVDCMSRAVCDMAQMYFTKWSSHLPAHASFDDVFMAGLEGLTIGVKKFDPSRGTVVMTSALYWVRTHVQRACYAQCGSAHIPEHLLQAGLDPSDTLLASMALSLDFVGAEDGRVFHEAVESPVRIEQDLHDLNGMRRVMDLLREVDEHLPRVAELMNEGYADREVAKITGIQAPRVKALREQAVAALRQAGY